MNISLLPILECSLELRAWGLSDAQWIGYVRVNGLTAVNYTRYVYPTNAEVRGINTVLLKPTDCSTFGNQRFDTSGDLNASVQLVSWINSLSSGTVVLGVSCYEARMMLTSDAISALSTIGVKLSGLVTYGKFAFVAVIGSPQSTVYRVADAGGDNLVVKAVVVDQYIVG